MSKCHEGNFAVKNMHLIVSLSVVLPFCCHADQYPNRTWTTLAGDVAQGRFVKRVADLVYIQKEDDSTNIKVSYWSLSQGDRKVVDDILNASGYLAARKDATPCTPSNVTTEIAAEMQRKNAAIDSKAGGAASGTGILGRMARNLDPRERASLALEQRFRNVDQPAMQERNAAELARQQEVTRGLRGQGLETAEQAKGAVAIAHGNPYVGVGEKRMQDKPGLSYEITQTQIITRDDRGELTRQLAPNEEVVGLPFLITGPEGQPRWGVVTRIVTKQERSEQKKDFLRRSQLAEDFHKRQAQLERGVRDGSVSEYEARRQWVEANSAFGHEVGDNEGFSAGERQGITIMSNPIRKSSTGVFDDNEQTGDAFRVP